MSTTPSHPAAPIDDATHNELTNRRNTSAWLDRARPVAALGIRVALGVLLLAHGLDKFDTGLSNVGGAFESWGVPLPDASATFVAVFEVIGGIALILGLATRLAAAVMTLILIGAIVFAKADMGLLGGAETDVAYIAALVATIVLGPGLLSADRVLGLERSIR